MSDIWNLGALCRCCHLDGSFKSLDFPYSYNNDVEVYSVMIQESLGISISKPPENMSFNICDVCIYKLRQTINFKLQILMCEEKFNEYLQNEQALNPSKEIKLEVESSIYNDEELMAPDNAIKHEPQYDSDNDNIREMDECSNDFKEEIKEELDSKELVKKSCLKSKLKKSATRTTRSSKRNTKEPKLEKPDKLFPCNQCESTFRSNKLLLWHFKKKHPSPALKVPYICTHCQMEFKHIADIYNHMQTHGSDKVKCRYCDKEFRLKRTQQGHENYVHIRQPCRQMFICDICNKNFAYKSTLRKHLLWHNGLSKKAFCEICGHGFNDNCNLRNHVETVHLKLRKFPCTQCDKTFTANKHLKNHISSKHDGNKPYACKECPARYSDWKAYSKHKLNHECQEIDPTIDISTTVYSCKACPEIFVHRGKFKAHVMKHNREGTSPNICHICGRGFSCKYSLKRHIDNHSGMKNYSCDICQKPFTQQTQVNRHKKNVHNPVKQERTKCPICKSNVRDMEKHKKRHVIRPFCCEMCPKSYPEKNALNRHVKQTHFGIFKHVCTICNTKCKTAKLLAKHKARRHPELKTDILEDYGSELAVSQIPVEIELK